MPALKVRFLGSGDAFGSGGRFQPCLLVEYGDAVTIIDFGSSSLIALQQYGVDPARIQNIIVSNFHGDHFGAVPYFIIDANLNRKRATPLVIAGPPGLRERLAQVMEATFPGSSAVKTRFDLEILELPEGPVNLPGGLEVCARTMPHAPGDPHISLRIRIEDKVLAYTGDTEWADGLADIIRDADLLISESYFYAKKIKYHMDYNTLMEKAPAAEPKRIVLVHMSPDMLAHLDQIDCDAAADGMEIEV